MKTKESKTYSKNHTLLAAAKSHMRKIRARGGHAEMKKIGKNKFNVVYFF